ncbi:MAG: hypothetical protein ACM3ZB_08155 [bacterium]|jgi:hypothetical protein
MPGTPTESDASLRRQALRAALQAAGKHYHDVCDEYARIKAQQAPDEQQECVAARRDSALRAFRAALRAFAEAVLKPSMK